MSKYSVKPKYSLALLPISSSLCSTIKKKFFCLKLHEMVKMGASLFGLRCTRIEKQAHLVSQPSDIVLLYCREICLDEISYKKKKKKIE